MALASKLVGQFVRSCGVRAFSVTATARSSAYDADGKTSVTILNNEPGLGLMIDTYSRIGFRLNNGSFVVGPVVIFPRTVMSWNVTSDEDISEKSLELLTILDPKPDVVVVGLGNHGLFKPNMDKMLHGLRVKKKLNLEILPTDRAVSTFNFLNAEGRYVVAALIPPKIVNLFDDDITTSRERRRNLYETDD